MIDRKCEAGRIEGYRSLQTAEVEKAHLERELRNARQRVVGKRSGFHHHELVGAVEEGRAEGGAESNPQQNQIKFLN